MADRSKIEWTDASWNPVRARNLKTGRVGWHCEHATTGCEFCYSEGFNKRLGTGLPFKPGHRKDIEIFLDEEMLTQPLRWKKPRKIFVCSMTDAFADFVTYEMLDKVFAVAALCPQHTLQFLTKRAKRMRQYLQGSRREAVIDAATALLRSRCETDIRAISWTLPAWPLPNVWLGVSAERQQEWDERKEDLRRTPAAVRFASFEPLLGSIVELDPISDYLQWAIVGGESGRNARPMHPDWARYLRDACTKAGVRFFFKQWGEWIPGAQAGHMTDADLADYTAIDLVSNGNGNYCFRVGKAAAGRLLDGVEHNEFPRVPA